jgi:DNA polymerase-3 subunit epsilon
MKLVKPLVFFDLETTGVNITTDRIVQIAIVKMNVDGSTEEKTRLINPEMPIPKEATEVHGITDEMVKDQPTFKQVAKTLKEVFRDCDIAGFNSDDFDVPLIIQEFARVQIEFPDWELDFVDVLKVERKVNSHKLGETFKRYTGETLEGAHDALEDTRATKTVFEHQMSRLTEIFSENEDFDGKFTPKMIDEFCQGDKKRFDYAGKTHIKEGVVYWSFGKCKDQPVLDDRGYLNWVLNQDFPIETKNKLKALIVNPQGNVFDSQENTK